MLLFEGLVLRKGFSPNKSYYGIFWVTQCHDNDNYHLSNHGIPIPSMENGIYLPACLIFTVNVGKYTIHGWTGNQQTFFSVFICSFCFNLRQSMFPFCSAVYRVVFFESVRCSSKSDSNGIDHVEHWIFSPHMDGAILQIQDSPTIYTNRHIQ